MRWARDWPNYSHPEPQKPSIGLGGKGDYSGNGTSLPQTVHPGGACRANSSR